MAQRSMPEHLESPDRYALGFVDALRRSGVSIGLDEALTYERALTLVDPTRRAALYWAGRTTLVHRPEDIARYDRAFGSWWLLTDASPADSYSAISTIDVGFDADLDALDEPSDAPDAQQLERPVAVVRWSPAAVLRHRDFAACSPAEFREAHRLIDQLRVHGATRRSRRTRPSRSARYRLDPRATVRAALRTHGEVVQRPGRRSTETPRRVVVLCDISGSMDPYTRAFLRFAHAIAVGGRRIEVFTIGTNVTRITRDLATRDPDAALAAVGRHVADWSGGTRLGAGLRAFNDRWGTRGVARAAIVVIVSDGWDRGDSGILAAEMQRLQRVAHRILWVNPLHASPGYEPTAKGMASALPFVDELVDGHSVASLESLAEMLAR